MANEKALDLAQFFAALSDRTRLRLLNLIRDGEVCVCFIAETLGTNNPKISRHLAYLKRAGLVAGRRDGKWMHYRINEPSDKDANAIFAAMLKTLENDAEMQLDRQKLVDVCCLPSFPIAIQGRK